MHALIKRKLHEFDLGFKRLHVKVLAHEEPFCSYMTPEHVLAVLKSYSIHITRHRAGTYSGEMKHRPNNNTYKENKVRHKYVPWKPLSILLTDYGAIYRHVKRGHAAGTKPPLTHATKHISGNMSHGRLYACEWLNLSVS